MSHPPSKIRTAFCRRMFTHGICKLEGCTFAHSIDELVPIRCKWDRRCSNPECTFFHPSLKETKEEYMKRNGMIIEIPKPKTFIIRRSKDDEESDDDASPPSISLSDLAGFQTNWYVPLNPIHPPEVFEEAERMNKLLLEQLRQEEEENERLNALLYPPQSSPIRKSARKTRKRASPKRSRRASSVGKRRKSRKSSPKRSRRSRSVGKRRKPRRSSIKRSRRTSSVGKRRKSRKSSPKRSRRTSKRRVSSVGKRRENKNNKNDKRSVKRSLKKSTRHRK